MSGIDRLRTLAGAWDEWGLGGALAEIADEIERERAEDCYRMGLDHGTVWRVAADMERHCLGHEGMEDSPVARWARELREALKSDTSDAADTQNPSCTGTAETAGVTSEDAKVTREDREALAWVREHGGIESVKAQRRESMPRAAYERKKAGFLDHIAECETALGRRREIISKLGHRVSDLVNENAELRRRAMPEGCEWPRFEDGEPVKFGDEASRLGEVFAICLYCDGSYALNFRAYSKDECVKRAVVDSWERLEEDAAKNYVDYWGCGGFLCSECPAVVDGKRPWERFGCGDYPEASKNCTVAKARDIVRRAKALTEKENRNE